MGETRYAFLPDGRRMDSREYWHTDEWKKVSEGRKSFDFGLCVICHAPADVAHHIDSRAYGHETMTDLISLCHPCHERFHELWKPNDFWKSTDDSSHWDCKSLEDTAKLCAMYWKEDMYLGGEYGNNMCSLSTCRSYIDRYFEETGNTGTVIVETDIQLFVRNKRYELWFNSGCGSIPEFLDKQFGEKVRGGNPIRRDAEQFYYRKWISRGQEPNAAMKETYEENETITTLMQEVKKYE